MTREEWVRVKDITAAALEQPEPVRSTYVVQACSGEHALEREVMSLLSSAVHASSLFETPVFGSPAAAAVLTNVDALDSPRVGARVGAYRIVREIGRGGMGTVFLADRDDQTYDQRVALKIVHNLRLPEAVEWFREERQILATLAHPNIARLLDGGTTSDGLPYLVMEYVEGVPVDEYCAQERASLRDRLVLFRTICASVDYAHRHLVVHRDLKPRNILVRDGVPKLLDFGIAKLLGPGSSTASDEAASETAPALFTPEYASPEQVRRESITTATDVYALGVLLYRLLTNRGPYESTSDANELAEAICNQPVARPSVVAATRQERRRLSGDIDSIVLKALAKDPAARYSSAGPLADDIGRYLAGLPVEAHENGLVYRSRKFVARHAFGVAAVALAFFLLAGGVASVMWQAQETERQRARAQRHFDDVRQLASSLIFEVQDSIENLPGTIQTRQLLAKRALDYFDGLAAEEKDDIGLQRELAQAYDKLGNVLGRAYAANLGDTGAALASYQKALEIRERLADAGAPESSSRLDLWSSYSNIGAMFRETAGTASALKLHQNAWVVIDDLLRADPGNETLMRNAAQTASTLSLSFVQAGRVDNALEAARRALTLDELLIARDPNNRALQNDVATARGRLGQILMKTGDSAARSQFEQAAALATGLVSAEPSNVAFRRRLSNTQSHLAQLSVRDGDLDSAWVYQQKALALREALAAQSPADRQASVDLMVSQLETGEVLARRGNFVAAAEQYRLAIERGEPMIALDPSDAYFQLSVATALTRLSQALVARGRGEEALPFVQRALELTKSAAEKDPVDARLQFELAMAYSTMGDIASTGSSVAARGWYQRSLDVLDGLRADGRRAGGPLDEDEAAIMARLEQKLGR